MSDDGAYASKSPTRMTTGTVAEGFLPKGSSPKGSSPKGSSPKGSSPKGYSPKGYSPKGYSPKPTSEHERTSHSPQSIYNIPMIEGSPGADAPTPADQAAAEKDAAEAPVQAENGITIDSDQGSFLDDGYETDSNPSISTSLASSMRNYKYENGRRYHRFREGTYNFPNDEMEQDREDLKHALVVKLCQAWYFAPVDNMQNILDMGTGTGIWAIEMGDQHPGASVLGVDLSPIQPEWVPPNVRFMVDDIESPWIHPPNHFDLIHSRHIVMAVKDWPRLLKNAYRHLKPGGWIELQEIHHFPQSPSSIPLPADLPLVQFWDLIAQGLDNLGVDFKRTLSLASMVRDCGYANVTERVFHVPIGTWPKNRTLKECGLYWKTVLMEGLSPIALGPLTRGLGWTQVQVEAFLVGVRQCMREGKDNAFMPMHIIYAQRPWDDV
ncbi:hypothetical protein V502_02444 [Pseudogymnoascus sp. VKM F-4520 (FW-2644)]|nr:hypothetical protein V502_02444 [Pseudogymnoascus sp. VKM F-4520 (FW-2644)]